MAQSSNGFFYEIINIPENFEIEKLKDFCQRLANEIQSVQSIKSPGADIKDFDDLEESSEYKRINDECNKTTYKDDDDDDTIFYDKEITSQPTFIFHLDQDSNNELTSSTLMLFDDIFANVPYQIKISSKEENVSQPEEKKEVIKDKKSRTKLTRRRIRKSFIYD